MFPDFLFDCEKKAASGNPEKRDELAEERVSGWASFSCGWPGSAGVGQAEMPVNRCSLDVD